MRTLMFMFMGIFASISSMEGEPTRKSVFGQCILPLGMEEGKIPDDAITASSSYEMKSVGPQNARIRQEKNGGAWCPKAQISSAIREYLEVDLTKDHLIVWTETQGRFGNGQGQEYAESFFLEYYRNANWHQYKNLAGEKVLRGNSNTYLVEKQKLELPFVASRVRFVPYSQHPRTVCMRVEIYGCVWEQHIVMYSAPKGYVDGPNGCNVEDFSYDGIEVNGLLTNGLGQLTDGIIGDDSEIIGSTKRTNWVGWKDFQSLEIVFQFQDIREFENCTIYLLNLPELEIEVFLSLSVWFSSDGKQYANPEKLEITEELRITNVFISIALQGKTGKFAKLEFIPKSKWLLISEITFETVSGVKNLTNDMPDLSQVYRNDSENVASETDFNNNDTFYEPKRTNNRHPDAFPVGNSQAYVGLVGAILTVIALLLTCTIFLMKQRGRNKVALLQKHTAFLCGSPSTGITLKDAKLPGSIVINGISQSRLSLRTKSFQKENREFAPCDKTPKLFSENSIPREDYSDVVENGRNQGTIPTPFPTKKIDRSTKTSVHEGYYAATDILTIKMREHVTSSSLFTPIHVRENMQLTNNLNSYGIPTISRHRLRILDKLGEGNFGLVHLCEAKGIQDPDLGTVRNRQVVIVRSLWRGVVDSLRNDFMKDMHALATIRDINIARIISLVEEEPFGAVFEYGELGDLPSYIENHEKSNDNIPLSYVRSLSFIAQIASGMKYLESLNVPHCDLAARNCIVTQNLMVKVSDHAMYCSKYNHEYYIDGSQAKIPLRWMSWESVLLGKQSCRADVWSYAVTAWQVLTNCKDLPYPNFTSEQVLENCARFYRGNERNQPQLLPKPDSCSDELYSILIQCWNRKPEDRPSFEEIYLYLKRLGFD